jgi:predicted nucleic acid-binding protein
LGLERLRAFLLSRRSVALDTSIFIYQLEANAKYLPLAYVVFDWLERRGNAGVTSTLTLTELLVPAYREGNDERIQAYYGLLRTFPNLYLIPPDIQVADIAARLRATYGLKTPDAIHAATAVHSNASAFITNDPVFKRVKEIESLVLDELL